MSWTISIHDRLIFDLDKSAKKERNSRKETFKSSKIPNFSLKMSKACKFSYFYHNVAVIFARNSYNNEKISKLRKAISSTYILQHF
jgi:hypothetical protein